MRELLEPEFLRNIVGKLTLLSRSATGLQALARSTNVKGQCAPPPYDPSVGRRPLVACQVGRVRGPVGLTTCLPPRPGRPTYCQAGRAMPTVTAGIRSPQRYRTIRAELPIRAPGRPRTTGATT